MLDAPFNNKNRICNNRKEKKTKVYAVGRREPLYREAAQNNTIYSVSNNKNNDVDNTHHDNSNTTNNKNKNK